MSPHTHTHPELNSLGGGGEKSSNSLCQIQHLLFYCRQKCSSQCVCSVRVWPENKVMWPIVLLLKDLPDWHCVSGIRHRAIGAVHSAETKSHRPQIWRWSPVVNHCGAMADDTERGINTTDVISAGSAWERTESYKEFIKIACDFSCISLYLSGATAQRWPGPPHSWGFWSTHSMVHHIRWDSFGWVIGPSQTPVPDDTQHSQQTDIHAAGGIRTRNLSKRSAADPSLRPPGHWNVPFLHLVLFNHILPGLL
jgi:hypothetical protein